MPGVRDQALLNALAAEIKARRATLQISQEELAGRCGLGPVFIARLETGVNQPSLTALVRLAKGLKVKPGEFVDCVMHRYRKERRLEQTA